MPTNMVLESTTSRLGVDLWASITTITREETWTFSVDEAHAQVTDGTLTTWRSLLLESIKNVTNKILKLSNHSPYELTFIKNLCKKKKFNENLPVFDEDPSNIPDIAI
ncbi:hypothetical protein P3S68_024625 [Capsicum galapagoense]